MTRPSLRLMLPVFLLVAVACKGDSVGPERVLTTLEVSAAITDLYPEATNQLRVSAWDQFGMPMLERSNGEWTQKSTYVSSAPQIAAVNSAGLVKGVAPGTAMITATLTLDGVTRTASVKATVLMEEPGLAATVTVNENGTWSPTTVRVKAGGTVKWVVPDGVQIGTIWLNVWGTNPEKLEFVDGRVTRTFSTPGDFYYGTGRGLFWYEQGGEVFVY